MTPAESLKTINAQDAKAAIVQFRAVNFADALGDTSVRTRRTLLLLATVGIVLASYSVNLKQIPWLDVPSPENAGDLIPTVLLLAIVYHLVAFSLYGISDVFKWQVTADSAIFSNRSQLVFRLDEHVRQLGDQLDKAPKMGDMTPWIRKVEETLRDAREVADDSIENWRTFYLQSRISFRLKQVAVWGLELALPLMLGSLASWRLCASMLHK